MRDAPRDRELRLLTQGRVRFGYFDDGVWRSTVDPRVRLRPTHWREMPAYDPTAGKPA